MANWKIMLSGIALTILSYAWYWESTKNLSVGTLLTSSGNPNVLQLIGIIGGLVLIFIGYFKK